MDRIKVLTLVAALVCAVSPADADLIPIICDIDAFTSSTDNYQTPTNISTPIEGNSLSVSRTDPFETRAALEFDISSLPPAGYEITAANLVLYASDSNQMVAVHGQTGNGAIESGDFTFDGHIRDFDPVSDPGLEPAENVIDVTAFIQAAAAGPAPYVVFQLRELHNQEFNSFLSTDNSIWSLPGGPFDPRPRLDVTTAPIPEPATLSLLGLGGLGVLMRRKRRKA